MIGNEVIVEYGKAAYGSGLPPTILEIKESSPDRAVVILDDILELGDVVELEGKRWTVVSRDRRQGTTTIKKEIQQ